MHFHLGYEFYVFFIKKKNSFQFSSIKVSYIISLFFLSYFE
jgi:hypothetical protein